MVKKNDYYKLSFFTPDGDKIADISSKTGQNLVNSFNFELNETGCGAFDLYLTKDHIDYTKKIILPFVWTKKTDMSVLPSADGWTYFGDVPEATYCAVAGGILNIDTVGTGTKVAWYRISQSCSKTTGYTIEFKMRLNSQEAIAYSQNIYFAWGDQTYDGVIYFKTTGIRASGWGAEYLINTTNYHKYRIVSKNNSWDLYIDDVFIQSTTYTSSFGTNKIHFGDGSNGATANSDSDWDYIYWTDAGAFTPGTATSTAISTKVDYDLRVGDVVEIYLMNEATPYYTGYIQKVPEIAKTDKLYKFSGYGFIAKLDEIVIDDTYSAQEVSLIVTDILTNQIIPKQPQIILNSAKIDVTAYTVADYYFNLTKAKKAISDLVNIAGNYVAGVDELREFFFKARSTTIQTAAVKAISKHLSAFLPNEDNSQIINKIYIKIGKLTNGSNFIATIEDLPSQSDYGIRESVESLPTTDESVDASQWAQRILDLKKDPIITATITNIDILKLRERIRAEGKARIILLKE